jgi:hypothetical protein
MIAKKNSINRIDSNKTVRFKTPLDTSSRLVRAGTIADGSCFYHAVLHARSQTYRMMKNYKRRQYVKKTRKVISSKMNKKKWHNLSDGVIANVSFQEGLSVLLDDVENYFITDRVCKTNLGNTVVRRLINTDLLETEKKKDLCTLLFRLFPKKDLIKEVLGPTYDINTERYLPSVKKTILHNSMIAFRKKIREKTESSRKRNDFSVNYKAMLSFIIDSCANHAFKKYTDNIEDTTVSVDSYTITLLSDTYNRDIYFIDAKTRMPYPLLNRRHIKGRKSIVLLWVNDNHYEVIGRQNKKNITWEFECSDPLIDTIYNFLFFPEKLLLNPVLLPYLPKELLESDSSSE